MGVLFGFVVHVESGDFGDVGFKFFNGFTRVAEVSVDDVGGEMFEVLPNVGGLEPFCDFGELEL